MPDVVWLNGRFVSRDEAKVSAFDAGIQHGVGLFETMLGAQGRVFRVERHMARLAESSQQLGLVDTLRTGALQEALQLALDKSKLAQEGSDGRARLRLTITGGDMNLLTAPKAARPEPTVMIVVTPATPYPPEPGTAYFVRLPGKYPYIPSYLQQPGKAAIFRFPNRDRFQISVRP